MINSCEAGYVLAFCEHEPTVHAQTNSYLNANSWVRQALEFIEDAAAGLLLVYAGPFWAVEQCCKCLVHPVFMVLAVLCLAIISANSSNIGHKFWIGWCHL